MSQTQQDKPQATTGPIKVFYERLFASGFLTFDPGAPEAPASWYGVEVFDEVQASSALKASPVMPVMIRETVPGCQHRETFPLHHSWRKPFLDDAEYGTKPLSSAAMVAVSLGKKEEEGNE